MEKIGQQHNKKIFHKGRFFYCRGVDRYAVPSPKGSEKIHIKTSLVEDLMKYNRIYEECLSQFRNEPDVAGGIEENQLIWSCDL